MKRLIITSCFLFLFPTLSYSHDCVTTGYNFYDNNAVNILTSLTHTTVHDVYAGSDQCVSIAESLADGTTHTCDALIEDAPGEYSQLHRDLCENASYDDNIALLTVNHYSAVICPNDDCTDICIYTDLEQEAVADCGSLESIISVDMELCSWECQPKSCVELQSECDTECGGYSSFECVLDENGVFESSQCDCDDCSLALDNWASTNCGGLDFLDWYDCSSDTGACREDINCSERYNACYSSCDSYLSSFSCDPETSISTCLCSEVPDIDNTPDSPDEYGIPDDTPDPSDPADDDSVALSKIVDNTAAITSNTALISDILGSELNELNDTSSDILAAQKETNNLLSNDNELTSSETSSLMNQLSEIVDTAGDNAISLVESQIIDLQENTRLDSSLFDGMVSDFQLIFATGECVDLTYEIPSLDKSITLSCDVANKWKLLLGFLFSIYTIMSLIDTLFRGISPKGSGHLSLWD